MRLPFEPPIEPMLAKAADALPEGDGWLFEPKWDGFRAIVFKDGPETYIQSRDLKPLALDPRLGALADNGGPTQTLLPQTGSPLIDAIVNGACQTASGVVGPITTDQRGLVRPQVPGGLCDIGAVEIQAPAPVVITPTFTG